MLIKQQGSELCYPFGDHAPVFKVMDKMFALYTIKKTDEGESVSMNLKCEPDEALALRATYKSVSAGYHMNKKHWNTVLINLQGKQEISKKHMVSMIEESYRLVFSGLTKVKQKQCSLLK